jgi:phosphoribosyl-ATP pyrophosphohydrolase/phosphoribosyl-AMP cyclohydrolase
LPLPWFVIGVRINPDPKRENIMLDINFSKYPDALVPAIIQDAESKEILMLGYVSEESLAETLSSGLVTFYSRSRKALWKKGESSGNFLELVSITPDCDRDALLILAKPMGPTCHRGTKSCFTGFDLLTLERIIKGRKESEDTSSYTSSLFKAGLPKIAQKVGEEGCEVVVAALSQEDERVLEESADLIFHLLILLTARNLEFRQVVEVLSERNQQ